MSLPDDIALYLEAIKLQTEPITRHNYRERLLKFSAWTKGRRVTKPLVLEYRRHLLAERLARSSIAMHLSTVRTFYRWLADNGHVMATENRIESQ